MAKKPSPQPDGKSTKSSFFPGHTAEIKGILYLTISILLILGVLSFIPGQADKNWLGLLGYGLGYISFTIFGLTSYFIPIFLGWLGWRLLFSKPINGFNFKLLYFITFIFSMAMLLSLLEDIYPSLRSFAPQIPYNRSSTAVFHLGGGPFYYLYHDLPQFNLKRILNTTGVALVFSSLLIISFLLICRIRLADIIALFRGNTNSSQEEIESPVLLNPQPKQSGLNPFLRYVKLRLPGGQNSTQASNASIDNRNPQSGIQQEMLAIHPEQNLTVRPSLSRKGQEDRTKDIEIPISGKKNGEINQPLSATPPPPHAVEIEYTLPKQIEGKNNNPQPGGFTTLPHINVNKTNPTHSDQKRSAKKEGTEIPLKKDNPKTSIGTFTYHLPSLNLLSKPKKVDQGTIKKDLKKQAEVLEETLLSFGIEAKVGQINCGPTINSFEVHPSIGVKVQKIKALEHDIALNMEAKSIRIIAPIPGKAAVGIEVPNPQPQEVGFLEMLQHYQNHHKFHIPILLGKNVSGEYVMSDLVKMPHCIIAGATGSGKSVCINTIVMSILMNARPDQIKLLMIDPKKVELTPYTRLPHMIAPVITEPRGACAALNWLVKEMESRYEILKQIGVRNIEAFNNRVVNKELEAALDIEVPAKMFYIVGIIDELADLMMVASADIETPIARIAQMARAVGIHLILATQRPSREVITGLIKANFPTRISFKVASRVNSQIVLDEVGAETLLGNGDMLFLPPASSQLIRAQGAFIRDDDINAVVKNICNQAPTMYLIESFDALGESESGGPSGGKADGKSDGSSDTLFEQAKEIVKSSGNASTTFLQRKLKIGYARAASLIDMLEEEGVISAAEGAKGRKILAEEDV